MMEFLYFPQDKSEYIPAVIMLLLFIVGAAVTMIWIIRASQKEEQKIDQTYNVEQKVKQRNKEPR
ncbi:hypothetical protein SAMN05192559_11273 [Halobacillus karajensis]|uniref:Uncharacterized protein n=1 Tax=Halobacillus karajensis TaxID=195088 RepID=A0A024PA51_9BACI|nr:hypothetical protein [Halobacillus karajensis]CDQ21309.1 hypothetical protein BN982_03676 [Halobacillus karajensis]CDQ25621.1 hypothetical protein BN983_03977 [Halobacillus karajensis]CDQ25892.1 hypothetical protein BN981_00098 [Halobacillus karajensis]SEI10552.1 hypothetical protein SAMN05192559_11273 [Halobacillus karajensis]